MQKKIIALLVSVSMLCGTFSTVSAAEFTDHTETVQAERAESEQVEMVTREEQNPSVESAAMGIQFAESETVEFNSEIGTEKVFDDGEEMTTQSNSLEEGTTQSPALTEEVTGTCGDNLQWKLSTDGVLTISGTGEMRNYSSDVGDEAPWYYYDDILKIVIKEGVTTIGAYAFRGCSSLTSMNIPEGVTAIGDSAFWGCSSLTSINIPEGVTTIGARAFAGCSSLTSINIPEGVTVINSFVFWACSSLTSINIPEGVTTICGYAFPECSSLTNINIPEGVTTIEVGVFLRCSSLTSINIPEGVTTIFADAFMGCSSLTSINIPGEVNFIGRDAFRDDIKLEDVYYGSTEDAWKKITIREGNDNLIDATIHYNGTGIGDSGFDLKSISEGSYALLGKENALFVNYRANVPGSVVEETQQIVWESSNPSILSVPENGLALVPDMDKNIASGSLKVEAHDFGTVTITGTSPDGRKASMEISVEPELQVEEWERPLTKEEFVTICFAVSKEPRAEYLQSFISRTKVEVDNPELMTIKEQKAIAFDDGLSAEINCKLEPLSDGIVIFTCTSPAGQKATVKLELKPELYFFDEYNYEEILTAWMESTGTANSIKYVTDGNHFPCTVAVAVSDKSFMEHFIRAQTNMMFRGFKGWKEIFAMESTEKEARKILLALLSVADKDIQELSIAEAGAKFASLYTKTLKAGNWAYAIEFGLNSDEVNQLEKVCKINNVEKYFIEGKYDKLSKELQRLSGFKVDAKVSECIDAFSKSDKMAKVLTDNLKYLSTSLKEMKLADSTVKRFCEVEKLRIANEMYSEMLLYIQNTCTLPPICEAASEIRAAIQNETWEQLKLLSEPIYDSVEDFAVDKLLSVIAKQIPMGQIVYDTFKFSVSLANTIFNTSDVQKQKDNMRCVAYIGECLSKWLKANRDSYIQESNNKNLYAKRAVYAYYTLLQLRTMGEKSFRKFEEISGRVSGPWQPGYEEYNYSLEVSSVLDSYAENLKTFGLINNYTTSVVSCPVNVQVYDSVGQLILTIDDQKETSGKAGNIYYYTYYHPLEKDYVKVVILPKEGGYSLKCNATAIGKVNYYVSQMADSGTVERRKASEMIVYPEDNITITNISSEKPSCKLERDDGESEKYDTVLEETTYTPVETVKMETDKTNLAPGESMLITASVSPENATYKNVAWISSDTSIATVNSDGVVTAVNSGEVIIKVYTVENKDITDELKITVKEKETEEPILPTPVPPSPTPEAPRPPVIVDPTPKPLPDYAPEGSKWDGDTIVTPKGTRIEPDGSMILPGKSLEDKADDTVVSKGTGAKNPSYNPKDETVIIQEGNTVTHPNEMVQKPVEGSVVNQEGTILMPDGTKITSDGITHRTDGGQTSYLGEVLKPAIPVCANVNAKGNIPTVVLEGQVYGAEGYDYVIGRDIDCIKTKDYLQIRKNQLAVKAQFTYLQKGTYYAYCHSWIRDKNGKKIFGAWSKPCEFKITATTPEKPRILRVKVNGRNVTVTYKRAKNASGYDLVLGTRVKKVNGESRPVAYGKYVIKNVKKNVESVTFKNVKPGTYYVGMHAYNRTRKDKVKVFSPWSNRKTIKIK